jgi:NADPH:quinone reductase-like Zn-dependent oxidoreductase
MAPSIMQALMREPSRSYQSIYADPSVRPLSPPSLRSSASRPTSIRSSASQRSVGSEATRRSAASAAATREPAWTNGQWDWSQYGGRGGLTGGARSLHTPSVVGKSLGIDTKASKRRSNRPESVRSGMSAAKYDSGVDDAGDREGSDVGSAWSVRSGDSLRTSMSVPGYGSGGFVPNSRSRSKPSRSQLEGSGASMRISGSHSGYDVAARSDVDRSSRYRSSSSRALAPSSFSASIDAKGEQQTSRRYSSQPSISRPLSPPLSNVSSRSKASRASAMQHTASDETTPSLTSSASSAPSSEPLTPITPHGIETPILLDGQSRKRSTSKRSKSSLAQPTAIEPAPAHLEQVAPSMPTITSQPEAPIAQLEKQDLPTSWPQESVPSPQEVGRICDFPLGRNAMLTKSFFPQPALPEPGRFYSVDEIFALAAPTVDANEEEEPASIEAAAVNEPSPAAAAVPNADQRAETLSPAVPRLRLTRTESEQSRLGARGSVELVVADEDTSTPKAAQEADSDSDSADGLEEVSESSDDDEIVEQLVLNRRSAAMEAVEEEPEEVEEATETISFVQQRQPQPRPQVSPQQPVLARFVEAKRGQAKRSSSSSSIDSNGSSDLGRAQVSSARSSRDRSSAATNARPPQSGFQSSAPEPSSAPQRTVQQLRSQEGSSPKSRPNMGRPGSSARSLRSRGSRLEVMPEDVEAEAEATSSGGEVQQISSRAQLAKLRTDVPNSTSSSERSISPSPRLASPRWTHSRSSSSGTSLHSLQEQERQTRSLDLDRDQFKPSPLARSMSAASSRPGSVRSVQSTGSNKSGKESRGLSKFFQPPLASSKATKPPPPAPAVVKSQRPGSPGRASSLRNISLSPHRFEEDYDDDDAQSLSNISIMSAPQLSPVRPPRNPARLGGTASVVRAIPAALLEPDLPSRDRYSVSTASSPRAESPAQQLHEARPLASSSSAVERPISRERTPPPMPAPIPGVTAMPAAEAVSGGESVSMSRANSSAASRPLSSHLSPSSVDFGLTSLALSPRIHASQQKTSRRFGLFRRSAGNDVSATKRTFEPSVDLVYDTIDATVFRKKLQSDEVLVGTIAVGVDQFDRERLWQLAKAAGGTGWVPGRALVGHVVAVGDSVSRLKKGDLVWGLSPLKKVRCPFDCPRTGVATDKSDAFHQSGALASLVILPRDNVALAPTSIPIELAAALPAPAASAMLIMQSLCQSLPKGSKVLVLNGHHGTGNLCLQLARHLRPGVEGTRDLWMVAQCPIFIRDAEKVCRDAGATEVLRDEPLAAINGLHEGSFDAVIDTVGGRRRERFPRSFRHWLFFWADDVSAFFAQSTTPRGESCTTAAPLSPRSATL